MRTLVVGDIHGADKALIQCLERCDFDPINDTLISLGDICDGWPNSKEIVEILQAIPNFLLIKGNHDAWALDWAKGGNPIELWVSQGGQATLDSFNHKRENFPIEFFEDSSLILESEGQVFAHGGIDPNQKDLTKQDINLVTWDRDLVHYAKIKHYKTPQYEYGGWKDIFVGHTTTQSYNSLKPLHFCNVWMIDTGAGWSGKLTIMDTNTKQFWQSDLVPNLYPNIKGRI